MPKPTTAAESTAIRVVFVTLDRHLSGVVERAGRRLGKRLPGVTLSLHAAAEWGSSPKALENARKAIDEGDIIIVTMLFMEEHIAPVLPNLEARRETCDAIVAGMSAGEVIRLTRLGGFSMRGSQGRAVKLLKWLRGGSGKPSASSGKKQLAMLRRLPRILRFVPGTAQDMRAYFLVLQYWLAASDRNMEHLVGLLIDRYADGPRRTARGTLPTALPIEYPETGVYHPRLKSKLGTAASDLPGPATPVRGTVGLLLMRSYLLAGDTAHYDGVIAALEARGLKVVPAFASGLDARPAVDKYFFRNGKPCIDALLSLTGFSLVGGPAYNDARAAEAELSRLDVPYFAAQAVEFQSIDQWQAGDHGLLPIEATMMVAIPELDGSIGHMVFGGRGADIDGNRAMRPHPERIDALASRIARMVVLRQRKKSKRKLAIVLFNFPPNGGSAGTAAHLSVFESLFNTLRALKADGYDVELPESVDSLKRHLLCGNAARFGTDANVYARVGADDHVRQEPWLEEIEAQWGPAPGRQLSDGRSIFIMGATFGNIFVGLQPGLGYEGDPMRLLFERGFAPTHAFSAFYTFLRSTFGADAILHFGTHGALEFMPGKQTGLSGKCWPDRLLRDVPNFYLYAANNPSEATIAKRRSMATTISYLTPPIAQAGLYKGLRQLQDTIERWRGLRPHSPAEERERLSELIRNQATALDLLGDSPASNRLAEIEVGKLWEKLVEYEATLVPHGLHIVGQAPTAEQRAAYIAAVAKAGHGLDLSAGAAQAIADGASAETALHAGGQTATPEETAAVQQLRRVGELLREDHEIPALLHALNGRYVPPVAGGDLLRSTDMLPTGRNIHGFDPFKIPSVFAVEDGARQADRLIERHMAEGNSLPESIAIVLWGADNLKSEGAQISQALALIGAEPRFDSYGRVAGAALLPLDTLGRPRIDVSVTLSGIFRDLLPLQTRMLAEAAYLAAVADESVERNFVRKHALAYQAATGCDLQTAALRVFSNSHGDYGSNVNHLVEGGCWQDEDELASAFTARKSFAYGCDGTVSANPDLLQHILGGIDLTYQNLESVELGVTTIDHYFDTLGGIGRAAQRAKGEAIPVYIGDQTQSDGKVRTLAEQVALETRTRTLNPAWYEAMLDHGHEGVRQIEAQVTNTLGWSATTGQVEPWVYRHLSETFVIDRTMRERIAALNPAASVKMANRLLEAHARNYWTPDRETLRALQNAGEDLEDRLEGVGVAA